MAKLGPDMTAGLASGSASASTSVMNFPVESSMPFEQRTTGVPGAIWPFRAASVLRVCCAGATAKSASRL